MTPRMRTESTVARKFWKSQAAKGHCQIQNEHRSQWIPNRDAYVTLTLIFTVTTKKKRKKIHVCSPGPFLRKVKPIFYLFIYFIVENIMTLSVFIWFMHWTFSYGEPKIPIQCLILLKILGKKKLRKVIREIFFP